MTQGTKWFRRFAKDCERISSDIRLVRVKLGFYRVYFRQAYIHEVYKEMPEHGYDIDEIDARFDDQNYYEEYEDNTEFIRTIKNYVEGYWESLDRIRTRTFLMRNNKEFNEKSTNAYKHMVIK